MLYKQMKHQNINKKNTLIHINLYYNKSSEQINITTMPYIIKIVSSMKIHTADNNIYLR